jgi:GSH-dependent disulfide-bond oxidoreductase
VIDLYTWPAPNGHKVQILVEELGIPYRVMPIDITQGDQHQPGYRMVNPNGKIPAIVDHAPRDGGAPMRIFESGAVMLYLAEKEGRFLPTELRARSEVLQWLFWQVGGLGPMMGQAQHFFRYAPQPVPYGVERYQQETRRLLQVLEDRLEGRDFIGVEFSIADMACFPWLRIHKLTGVSLQEFPRVLAWYGRVRARPAVGRGVSLLRERWVDVTTSDDAKRNLFSKPST